MSEGLKKKIQESIDLLTEVVEKRGAYSQDYLQHAENVIENASKRAAQVTETLKKISGWLDEAAKQIQEIMERLRAESIQYRLGPSYISDVEEEILSVLGVDGKEKAKP